MVFSIASEQTDGSTLRFRVWVNSFIISSQRPPQLWGPLCLVSYAFTGCVLQGTGKTTAMLATHFHIVPRFRMRGTIPQLPRTSSWSGVIHFCAGRYFWLP